jgi:hypothetical protein
MDWIMRFDIEEMLQSEFGRSCFNVQYILALKSYLISDWQSSKLYKKFMSNSAVTFY